MRPGIVVLLAVGLCPALAMGQGAQPAVVVVAGASSVHLPSDHATLNISIVTRARTAAAAAGENGRKQRAVLDALGAMGYGPGQARAIDFAVTPVRDDDHPNRTPSAYDADISVAVAVADLSKLGATIDAALAAGGSDVRNIEFISDSARAGRERALGAAYESARLQAETLAKASGARLGRLIEISMFPPASGDGGVARFYQSGVVESASIVLTPRDVEISETVYVRWELVPQGP
jgi:uncharacterized protein YggE